jgi:adenine/guanine phosphoribosyltransferase-like PRPP-binding protein
MSLAKKSLRLNSLKLAQLWQELNRAEDREQIEQLFTSIWQAQNDLEQTVDSCVDLARQIEAEIVAVKARMEYLVNIHKAELAKLESWRSSLDRTILTLNERGAMGSEAVGKYHRITIKENPPSCELEIEPEQLPKEYQRQQIKIFPDKKAIIAAWKKGIPIEGTVVSRNRKVNYGMIQKNLLAK